MRTHYTILDRINSRDLIFKTAIVFLIACMTLSSIMVSTAYAKSLKFVNSDNQKVYEEKIELEYLVSYSNVTKVIDEIEKLPKWIWEKFINDEGTIKLVNFIDFRSPIKGHENDLIVGLYHQDKLQIYISLDVNNGGVESTLHEFGHYFDRKIKDNISLSNEFQNIYNRERQNFFAYTKNDYATADVSEYFAEAFQQLYKSDLTSQNLYTYCPDTWIFINNLVN